MRRETSPNKPSKIGEIRIWAGLGLFALGSFLTIGCAQKSLTIGDKGDNLGRAEQNFFGKVKDSDTTDAVYRHLKSKFGETVAYEVVDYRLRIPSESGDDLTTGCNQELPTAASAQTEKKCESLGHALEGYTTASNEFNDSMPTESDVLLAVGGSVVVLSGIGVGVSGLMASKRHHTLLARI